MPETFMFLLTNATTINLIIIVKDRKINVRSRNVLANFLREF